MWKYVVKRILFLIPIILLSSLLIFILMSFTGDPVYALLGENATEEEVVAMREKLGLNDPLLVRYGRYMWNVVTKADFGTDIYSNSVWEEYTGKLPYTLALAALSILCTAALAIPLGITAATHQNSLADVSLSATAIMGLSIPNFWLGLLMMLLFSLKLGWLPTSGADEGIKSIIMPTIASTFNNMALICRMVRSSMLDCIRADYLRTARAKGVKEKVVVYKHAFKNAIIPILTAMSNQFAMLIGGSVVVESVFAWPGVGNLIISAVKSKDGNAVTGYIMMTTVFVASVLLIVDVIYAYCDPRIKAQYQGK